ncbi:MAG TPA: hypothetical protein VME67_06305 [Mycobacterium sp.]|nr:hypothetical protein [Mycobacterium sp.]HTX94477.1 hypothetical protein [Mycobacterium sp.]
MVATCAAAARDQFDGASTSSSRAGGLLAAVKMAKPTEDEGGIEACPLLIAHAFEGSPFVFAVR